MGKATTIEERQERKAEPQADEAEITCQHHWVIETPRGALSLGRCKRCGEERDFRNSATDHLWEAESGSGYNAWRGIRAPRASSDENEVAASPRARNERSLIA